MAQCVNHHPGPAIACCGSTEIAAQQCPAKRTATVNYQHSRNASFRLVDKTGRIHCRFDQRIVFMALHRHDRSTKFLHRTEITKSWWKNPEITRGVVLMGITQVTSCDSLL